MRSSMIRSVWVSVLAAGLAWNASAVEVFESQSNDGTDTGTRTVADDGSPQTLNLYVTGPGTTPSSAGTECSGTGTGDEYCGVDLSLVATSSLQITAFTPDPGADVIVNWDATSARFNFGNPFTGEIGPTRVATIEVTSNGGGTLVAAAGKWVGSALTLEDISNPGAVLADSCGDTDADTFCVSADPCPSYPNAGPFTPGVIPGECLCGDANANGVHEFSDAFTIIGCANLSGNPAFCSSNADVLDANGNGVAEFSDAFAVIAQANTTATIAPHQLVCPRRPEGTPPP